jgi:serine protease Do
MIFINLLSRSCQTKRPFLRLIVFGVFKSEVSRRTNTIMSRISRYPTWVIAALLLSLASMAGGAFLGSAMVQAGHAPEAAVAAAAPPVREAATMPSTFAPVVKAVLPAVVSISSTRVIRTTAFQDNPFGNWFPGFQLPERPFRQQGEGSGVIVSSDGYIVTNDHVIDGATELTVAVADNGEMKARVVGRDAKTDIALIKVDAKGLRHVSMGSSASVEVGDIALAMGNPFGLGQTVTMGIVSATGRGGLGIEEYEDFIQTDASINPGNSGGALVNTKGELIGINTAILSRSGGNQGVGFAVPVDMVRQVITQLKDKGVVTRARLGITFDELTPQLASELGVKASKGAVVNTIVPNSPASRSGLRENDVIVALNGKEVDGRSLRLAISSMTPGTEIDLKILRKGGDRMYSVTLDTMPADTQRVEQNPPFSTPRRGRRG